MTCPTCNSPVTVEGHTTNYYVPSGSNIEDGQAGAAKWAQERLERYGIVEQATKELNERLRTQLAAAEEALRFYTNHAHAHVADAYFEKYGDKP